MVLQSITPNLMVRDVNSTIDFYTELLGFTCIQTVPEAGIFDWAMVQSNGVDLMFQQEKSIKDEYSELESQSGGGALTLYIRVKEIEKFYNEINDKVTVIKALSKTFYGANEFAIVDPNGFILTFSELPE